MVAIYVGLPLVSLLADSSPLAKLDRPEDSLTRLVSRELDLYHAMRGGSGFEWRLYQLFAGAENPTLEASEWYEELADTLGTPTAELHRAILLAETGDKQAVEQAIAEWRDGGPSVERMASWLTAAYLEKPSPDEGRELIDEIRDALGPGWFADTLTARIAAAIGDARASAEAEAAVVQRGRVLQQRLRVLMGLACAAFAAGAAGLVWIAVGRRSVRVADAPLPPVWRPGDGYALFVRGLGAPQVLLLILYLVGRQLLQLGQRGHNIADLGVQLPLEGALAIAADLPILWWIAHCLRSRGTSMREALGLTPAPGRWGRLGAAALALIALALAGDALIDWGVRRLGFPPHWADGLFEGLLWEPLGSFLIDAFSAVVWAPIVEEIVFRGLLYGTLRTFLGMWPAAIASAAIFALPHGYAVAGSLSVLMSGVLWALAYERTRSLLPGMIAHAANNLMSTLWVAGLLRM